MLSLLLAVLSSTTVYQAPPSSFVPIVQEVETIDTKVTHLSKDYRVSEDLVRAIITCESQNDPLAVNLNKNGTRDYGPMQINEVHKSEMERQGLDIKNPDHTLQFGVKLLATDGTVPWKSSKPCWQKILKSV